jgi:hypothetical protein
MCGERAENKGGIAGMAVCYGFGPRRELLFDCFCYGSRLQVIAGKVNCFSMMPAGTTSCKRAGSAAAPYESVEKPEESKVLRPRWGEVLALPRAAK